MRPMTLDMQGFASFRDEAHVDFGDAEFFALVGPTGSGKSTVIDAMTFALYGSVPRWGRKGMVSLALSPTVARGTVKLVFEVDRQRYVVARELRRVGGTVSQRAASLERLADPRGLAQPGDQTFPLAKDLDGVNEAVEKLLGLRYEDFIQCVVLPQGQFAAFLHAKPSERQDILLRLLGAEHYRLMMMRANQRATVAAQRAGTYGEELAGYADATPEAESGARGAQDALARLGEQVKAALPLVSARQDELKAADGRLRQLRAETAALSALRVPHGTGRLDADLAASRSSLAALRAAERAAEAADTDARDALAAGPQRAPLELARAHRTEHARHQAAIPGLAADVSGCGARSTEASGAVDAAAIALDQTRAERDEASRAAGTAAERVTALAAEHARLTAVSVPAGITELDERRTAAAGAVAAAALEDAERADAAARAARAAAAPEAPLAQAHRDLADLRDLLSDAAAAGRVTRQAEEAREAADAALAAAEEARRRRQAELEEARRANVVAGLRPHLVAGEPCPVCEQAVMTLPVPLPAGEADAAQARLGEADRAVTAAQSAAREAAAAAAQADAGLAAAAARGTALATSLAAILASALEGFPLPAARAIAAAPAGPAGGARPGSASRPGGGGGPGGDDETLASALSEVSVLARARRAAEQAAGRGGAAGAGTAPGRAGTGSRNRGGADRRQHRAARCP
jgi:exonuclease SbcC